MPITVDQYSRRQTLDLDASISAALRRKIEGAAFEEPGASAGPVLRFQVVHDTWAGWSDETVTPAACVVPSDDPEETSMAPSLILETWEPPQDHGFGLYAVADVTAEQDIAVRATTPHERDLLVAVLERLFYEEQPLLHRPSHARVGVILTMDEYFGLPVRVLMTGKRKLDDADTSARNAWEAIVTVRVHAQKVVLGPVAPFVVQVVHEVVDEIPGT